MLRPARGDWTKHFLTNIEGGAAQQPPRNNTHAKFQFSFEEDWPLHIQRTPNVRWPLQRTTNVPLVGLEFACNCKQTQWKCACALKTLLLYCNSQQLPGRGRCRYYKTYANVDHRPSGHMFCKQLPGHWEGECIKTYVIVEPHLSGHRFYKQLPGQLMVILVRELICYWK